MDKAQDFSEAGGAPRLTRRQALRRIAAIGGSAFVLPMIETITISRAAAQVPSSGKKPYPPPAPPEKPKKPKKPKKDKKDQKDDEDDDKSKRDDD